MARIRPRPSYLAKYGRKVELSAQNRCGVKCVVKSHACQAVDVPVALCIFPSVLTFTEQIWPESCIAVADPEGGGGVRGFKPPPSEVVSFFFCLSVYENSHGPGP